MKKLLGIIFLSLLWINASYANKNKNTWDYPLIDYRGWVIKGSKDHYKFQSDLREDKNVLKEFKKNKDTGIISYLLFENDKIVIDVADIPKKISSGEYIIDGLLPSHSMGKSLVSYVTGHAICEGYIDSINVKLNDWPLIQNTLYEDAVLLDLLNMKGGDQKWVGERRNVGSDNRIKGGKPEENVSVIGLEKVMSKYLKGTEKSKLIYNYSALTTNVIMNYVKFKAGDDWDKLLHKVFNEHVKVKNSVELYSTLEAKTGQATGWQQTGSISIATNKDRLTHIRRQASLSKTFGIIAEEITTKEAAEKWPLMRTGDILGTIFSPSFTGKLPNEQKSF